MIILHVIFPNTEVSDLHYWTRRANQFATRLRRDCSGPHCCSQPASRLL